MNRLAPALSAAVSAVLIDSLAQAGAQLSLLVDREITFRGSQVDCVRLEELSLSSGLEPDCPVTAVYLAFSGDLDGHVMLSFTPQAARYLAHALLLSDSDLDVPAMRYLADSMIGELGNVAASAFLNAISGATGLSIRPSPPFVAHDMWGAVLDSVLVEVAAEQRYGLLLRADFVIDGDPFAGNLMLLPSLASGARLEQLLATV